VQQIKTTDTGSTQNITTRAIFTGAGLIRINGEGARLLCYDPDRSLRRNRDELKFQLVICEMAGVAQLCPDESCGRTTFDLWCDGATFLSFALSARRCQLIEHPIVTDGQSDTSY
jgi:hypothetical protein